MALFSCYDQTIEISLDRLNEYPECLLSLMWRWHLLSNPATAPCRLENVSLENFWSLEDFFLQGAWLSPWSPKSICKYNMQIEGVTCKIWDYFMLPQIYDEEDEEEEEQEDGDVDEFIGDYEKYTREYEEDFSLVDREIDEDNDDDMFL